MATRWLTIREDRLSGQHMPPDGLCQRLQQRRGLADPVGQRRAVEVEPLALEDLALAIERQMVGVFGDQHMRQQAGAGTAALDRAGWQGGLCEGFAAGTGHARADDPVHDEPAGHILQLFGHILAQAAQRPAAMGTVIVASGQLDLLARDMIGDGPTLRLVLLPFVRQAQLRGHPGDGYLAGFQGQLKL